MSRSPLTLVANPRSIVVFGASPTLQSIGGGLTRNLLRGNFPGQLHLINPRHGEIEGRRCHRSLSEISGHIDLALIATPAPTVPDIVDQCGRQPVKAAVIYSGGFAETG